MTISTHTATTSLGTAYTSSGNSAITFMSFCNSSGTTTAEVDVYVVPSGTSYAPENRVYSSLQLTPNDTYQLYLGGEKLILGPGDTVQVQLGAGSPDVSIVTSYTSI